MATLDINTLYKNIYAELNRYILASRKDLESQDPAEHKSFALLETYDQCFSQTAQPKETKKTKKTKAADGPAAKEPAKEPVKEKSIKIAKFVTFSEDAKKMLAGLFVMCIREVSSCAPEAMVLIDTRSMLTTEEVQAIAKTTNNTNQQELIQLREMSDKRARYILDLVEKYIYGPEYSYAAQLQEDPQYFNTEKCATRFIYNAHHTPLQANSTLDSAKDPELYISNKIKQCLDQAFPNNARVYEVTWNIFNKFLKVLGHRVCCNIWYSGHPANFNKTTFAAFLATFGMPLGLIEELIQSIPVKPPKPAKTETVKVEANAPTAQATSTAPTTGVASVTPATPATPAPTEEKPKKRGSKKGK